MPLLEKLWDDVVAGPQPERGLGKLRKIKNLSVDTQEVEGESSKYKGSLSAPGTLETPTTPTTPSSAPKHNVWRSVFHPGSNLNTKGIGAHVFDKPAHPNSPTIYDWLYSGETKSQFR